MAKKTQAEVSERFKKIVANLATQVSPDVIQVELGRLYEEFAAEAETETEVEFWYKCHRASMNLASGMNKWAHEMVEDMLEEEDD